MDLYIISLLASDLRQEQHGQFFQRFWMWLHTVKATLESISTWQIHTSQQIQILLTTWSISITAIMIQASPACPHLPVTLAPDTLFPIQKLVSLTYTGTKEAFPPHTHTTQPRAASTCTTSVWLCHTNLGRDLKWHWRWSRNYQRE